MKIITINKKFVIVCLAFVLVVSSVIVALNFAFELPAVASNGLTVVIDAGHGGRDGGVSGVVTGTHESEINLAIAKSLKHFLKENGYKVVMTRENADGLYGNVTSGFKRADMLARKNIINFAQPDLVISIHQNFYPRLEPRGAQVFYAPKSEEGKTIAEKMKGVLKGALPESDRTIKSGDYYILQCTEYPSLLIECGFLSNAEDEKLLVTAVYQEKVAYAIYAGVKLILQPPETIA